MNTRTKPVPRSRSAWKRRGLLRLALAVVFLLVTHTPSQAQSETDPVPNPPVVDASPDAFRAVLDSMRARSGFPGATAAYVWTDGPSGVAATGVADAEPGTPMTPNSRMLAASIGKTVVGATAAGLAEEGVLDLDAPVARWLGDRPWFGDLPNHEEITLRHLLTHRSGLPDHVHTDAFAEAVARRWQEPGNPFPPDTLVQFILGRPALFEPGDGWAYSDTGFILAGLVIEAATGRSYYEEIQERFLTPLALDGTGPSNRRGLSGLATGYAAESPLGFPTKTTVADGTMAWHPGIEWTGGGLVTTARDLARWGAALFGGHAVSAAAREQVLASAPLGPETPTVHYGLGVGIYTESPFGPVYGHGGWIPGYTSSLRYYADYGVAIAFQINTDIGLESDTGSVVQILEARLAEAVLSLMHDQTADRRHPDSR